MNTQLQATEVIRLTIQDEHGPTLDHELRADSGVFVGKSANCGLQLRDQTLSEIHCRIGFDNGSLWVQDWMSSSGTRLNGVLIDSQSVVKPGDVIQIGKAQISVATAAVPTNSNSNEARSSNIEDAVSSAIEQTISTIAEINSTHDAESETPDWTAQALPDGDHSAIKCDSEPASDFNFDFTFEEAETYDHETVALLRAEIEELQTALAQQEARSAFDATADQLSSYSVNTDANDSDSMIRRMEELIDEANRSDERVSILEELLHAAEDANRAEQEERVQLTAWVDDIENRIGQRENEHAAEIDALRIRLEESQTSQHRLQRQMQEAAFSGSAPRQYELTLENLQTSNRELQNQLAESQNLCQSLTGRVEELATEQERALREERARIAQEQAKLARIRFELSKKLADVEELPKTATSAYTETTHRIQALRDHLREIHEQEQKEEKEASLTTRLTKLWRRIERGQNG